MTLVHDFDLKKALIEARELLSDPVRWTQGCSARDANGRDLVAEIEDDYDTAEEAEVPACRHPRAASWCLSGALSHVTGETVRYDDPRFKVLWDLVDGAVGPWNDRHEHEDVLAVLDEAISRV